jgi:hypothetical protein
VDASRRWGDGEGRPDVVRTTRGSPRLGPSRSSRRRSCDADRGHAPAVAKLNLRDAGSSWELWLCADHLAAFEAELGGWSTAG